LRNLALAHFAITDIDGKQFRYYEKLNRASKFTANAATGYLDVFNEGWRMTTTRDGSWRLIAADGKDAIDLTLRSGKPHAIRGDQMQVRALRQWHSKKSGATYPMKWSITIPSLRIALALDPLLDDQELITRGSTHVTYWEGAVDVEGSFDGVAVRGEGYVEM